MLRSLCLVACLAVALRANVIVVDPAGGPGGAALLQAALAAAQPGDILLLRSGDYSSSVPIGIDGKGLTLVADAGHSVHLPSLRLTFAPATQPMVVRGLDVGPPNDSIPPLLLDSDGPIWVEGGSATGANGSPGEFGPNGAYLESPSIVVTRGTYHGGRGGDSALGSDAMLGGQGLSVSGLGYAIFDVTATGGRGGDGTFEPLLPPDGGPGLSAPFGLWAAVLGGVYTGGDEGLAVPATAHGGPGANFGFITAYLRGASLVPGGVTGEGFPGVPYEVSFGSVKTWTAPLRELEISSPVREFGTADLTATGMPGDLLLVLASLATNVAKTERLQGALVVPPGPAMIATVLGTLDASGTLQARFVLPALPAGIEGLTVFTQLVAADAQGETTLGGASALTWISAAF